MSTIEQAYQQILQFKGVSLGQRVQIIEHQLQNQDKQTCINVIENQLINLETLGAALIIKKASSQIDEIVHTLGILLVLPKILNDGEVIISTSLAAGNSGRTFDLETDQRIAEFKFINWRKKSNTIRQNQFFKDFYTLAEYPTNKKRYLYSIGPAPIKFLNGRRDLRSIMSKNVILWNEFQTKYPSQFKTVREYYAYRAKDVHMVDLVNYVPLFQEYNALITQDLIHEEQQG